MVNRLKTWGHPRSLPVPASECRRDGFGVPDALDQEIDAVAAPKQLAVEDHGRHAEYAERFCLIDDAVMFRPCGPTDIGLELTGRTANGCNHTRNIRQLVDFEVMAPEAPEHRVVVGPEQAVALREQHAGTGMEGVIDASRAFHDETLRIGIA